MLRTPLSMLLLAATLSAHADPSLPEPGTLLRTGEWGGGAGTFMVPQSLSKIAPATWPKDGWHRLTLDKDGVQIDKVEQQGKKAPVFLQEIVHQIQFPPAEPGQPASNPDMQTLLYLRVPGTTLSSGKQAAYIFKNGSTRLQPQLDYRYELKLGEQAFAFTVQNGFRGKNGAPYGEGGHYTIEYDGQRYEYHLEGFGWGTSIAAIADLDGDGKPDFILQVEGSNTSYDMILLSSKAKPGKNPVTASIYSVGC